MNEPFRKYSFPYWESFPRPRKSSSFNQFSTGDYHYAGVWKAIQQVFMMQQRTPGQVVIPRIQMMNQIELIGINTYNLTRFDTTSTGSSDNKQLQVQQQQLLRRLQRHHHHVDNRVRIQIGVKHIQLYQEIRYGILHKNLACPLTT